MLDALSNEVAQNPDAMRDAAAGTERMNGQRRGNEICQQLHDLSRAKFRIEQAARALSDSKPGENGGMHVCRIIAAEPPQNRRYEIALAFFEVPIAGRPEISICHQLMLVEVGRL